MNTRTRDNLMTSLHGEAFAYAKYMLYAEHARRAGRHELAKLFEETARTELFEHFAEEAELAGIIGHDTDNVRDAIGGESYEIETMYREFAEQARVAGDHAAADRFEEVRRDEMAHREAFKVALRHMDPASLISGARSTLP
ncbi:MAG TPA: rubrerythrin family protein [Ktedonobacterales bacterium]|nr:rubrerythrin family protein [Ktedonobacterales bacterium]